MGAAQNVLLLLSLAALEAQAQCGFDAPVRYASTADQIVLVRDLDGDGKAEIIASGNHVDQLPTFSLLANRGDGTFAPERLVAAGFGQHLEQIADLDGDGAPDLLAADYWANSIALYRNLGSLGFTAGTSYPTATHGGPTLVIDYDHDGKPDVISLSFGSGNPVRAHFFPGRGDGTLAPKTTFQTDLANGDWPSARTIGGALEVLVGERSGNLAILRYADGALSTTRLPAGLGFDLWSTFADVNEDGVPDIIDTDDRESPSEPVYVTLGNPDGSFRERRQLPWPRTIAFPMEAHVADVDGDGHADVVVADFRAPRLHFYRGDGHGNFAAGVAIEVGGPVNTFAIADVNGDGRLDLVTGNEDHTVSVVLNLGACPSPRRRVLR